jgi:hypothetical protein
MLNVGTLNGGSTNTASPSGTLHGVMFQHMETSHLRETRNKCTTFCRKTSLKAYTAYIGAKLLMITIFHNCCRCKSENVN